MRERSWRKKKGEKGGKSEKIKRGQRRKEERQSKDKI